MKKALFSKKKYIFLLIIATVGVGIYFAYFKQEEQKTTLQTTKAKKETLVAGVSGSGNITSANSFSVSTAVSGTVTKVHAKDGDKVTSGQILAEINLDQESKQNYSQALASYQNAKNSIEAAKTANKTLKSAMIHAQQTYLTEVVYRNKDEDNPDHRRLKAEMQAAEEKYKNQEDVIKQAELAISSAWYALQQASPVIYSPTNGTITGFSLQIGSVITSQKNSSNITVSSRIANVITEAAPMVSINLTEIDIPKVKIGNFATVTLDALPTKTFKGKVISIDTTGEISSGVTNYPTVIQLDTNSPDIFSNMSATATIIYNSKENVVVVPNSAIVNRNGKTMIRIPKDEGFEHVQVETGLSSDSSVEITSGISEGQEVVTAVNTNQTNSSTTSSPFGIRTGGFGGTGRVGR